MPRRLPPVSTLVLVLALAVLLALSAGARAGTVVPGRTASTAPGGTADPASSACTQAYPARRTRANPLMLATQPTGGDPLRGASFFVSGPARGAAAGAIAQLLGIGTGQKLESGSPLGGLPDTLSWATFQAQTVDPGLASLSAADQQSVTLLEKIASEPIGSKISAYSGGGSPAAVQAQTEKLFCDTLQADPGTVPIILTYFAHAELGGCATAAQIKADLPHFRSQINAMARGIDRRPAAVFVEEDAVGSSSCMVKNGAIHAWEALIRYEALKLESLPHTAVYIEGGYSDANNAADAARLLNAMGVRRVQGFFTNDTHIQWTSHELAYAKQVSARTGGAHFVINTAGNGQGPLLNPHPSTQGVEDLCNPPGRGLGIPPTTATQTLSSQLDALLWLAPPGNSAGPCNGGPSSGTFWVAKAEALAAAANAQLGPGYPSLPY